MVFELYYYFSSQLSRTWHEVLSCKGQNISTERWINAIEWELFLWVNMRPWGNESVTVTSSHKYRIIGTNITFLKYLVKVKALVLSEESNEP